MSNPDDLPIKYALAYAENREDYREATKDLWIQAAAELFGD